MKKFLRVLLVVCLAVLCLAAISSCGSAPADTTTAPVDATTTASPTLSYPITYKLGGGTNATGNPTSYMAQDEITLADPIREGFTFLGWKLDGVPVTGIARGTTGAKTFVAEWEAITYTITYNLNGGTNAAENPATYTANDSITLAAPTREGYRFLGWKHNGNPILGLAGGTTGDKTFVAEWETVTYAITYNLNGGTNATENPATYTVEEAVTLVAPIREGYTFLGWKLDGEPATGIVLGTAGDKTLVAEWEAISYTITYNLNGGTNAAGNPATYTAEDAVTLAAPTREGFTFVGWTLDGASTTGIATGTIGNKIFVAEWGYSITYHLNGGELPTKYASAYKTESGVTLPYPLRSRYQFAGWYENSDFTGECLTEIPAGSEGNKVYYAKWIAETDGIQYKLITSNRKRYYSVIGYTGTSTTVIIPATVNDIPVTDIASYAFDSKQRIKTISIPSTVKTIGEYAFLDCASLSSLVIPDSVTSIGKYAFSGCAALKSVTILGNVTAIEEYTFSGCTGLTSVTLPSSVTAIGKYAFDVCASLTGLVLPEGMTTIGEYAFRDCVSLSSLVIPDSVTGIGKYAFSGCSALASITIPESMTAIDDYAFYKCTGLTSITFPSSVTTIGKYAFYGCTGLKSVTLSEGMTSIGEYAFYDSSLTFVTIPNSVTTIGNYAFRIPSLTSVTISEGVTTIGKYAFASSGLKSVIIPSSVTSLGEGVFANCQSLSSVIFAGECQVKRIPEHAFYNCGSLRYMTIPESVTAIEYEAFYYCSALKTVYIADLAAWCRVSFESVSSNPFYYGAYLYIDGNLVTNLVIPDTVTKIGDYAFYNCAGLNSVTIPRSVTTIGRMAFNDAGAVLVTIPESVTQIGAYAFDSNAKIYSEWFSQPSRWDTNWNNGGSTVTWGVWVTQDGLILKESASGESYEVVGATGVSTALSIPDTFNDLPVTDIGERAFYGCKWLTSVEIGNSVTSICEYAFYGCTGLTSITLPDNLEYIGDRAFSGCSSLPSVEIGNHVTYIGSYAFYGCTSLKNAKISDSVLIIDANAFEKCSALTSVELGSGVTNINGSVFSGCTSLKSVYIADVSAWLKIAFINANSNPLAYGADLFVDGVLLTNLVIPGTVTGISSYAFYNYSSLISVTVDDGVTSIGDAAFYGCTQLPSLTLPVSVVSIGSSAFKSCSALASVTLSPILTFADSSVFDGCTNITSATIPASKISLIPKNNLQTVVINGGSSIDASAFKDCKMLENITIPDSVTSIGNYAFSGCKGLTSITIGDSVTTIGYDAFGGCTGLTSITLPFVGRYKNGSGDLHFGYIFGASSFSYNNTYVPSSLKTVVITGGTSIGYSAFYGCSGLTGITIPDSVTSIGEYAFRECTGLTSITIGDSVTTIGYDAFGGCKGLTSVTIGNGVTSIGSLAFVNCTGLTSITIPDSVTSIGYRAFFGCTGLTSITIGKGVTSIDGFVFYGCTGLASVTFENTTGWKAGGEALSSTELANTSTAAMYLRSTYRNYEWTRS